MSIDVKNGRGWKRAVIAALVAATLAGCGSGSTSQVITPVSVGPAASVSSTPPVTPRAGAGGAPTQSNVAPTILRVLDPESTQGPSAARAVATPTPASAMIASSALPPVLDQGGIGSCGAFALGYALATFTVNQGSGGNAQSTSLQSSPAYMYALALKENNYSNVAQGANGVTYSDNYFDPLLQSGSVPVSVYAYPGQKVPVAGDCSQASPSDTAIETALDPLLTSIINGTATAPSSTFVIGDWGWITPYPTSTAGSATTFTSAGGGAQFLDHVKAVVASGQPVGILVQEYADFDSWYSKPARAVMSPKASNLNGGYHFMVVIGYDDTIPYTNSEGNSAQGAVRIQNSWGVCFGDGGYFWLGYAAFLNCISEGYVAYPVNAAPSDPSGVTLSARSVRIPRVYQTLHSERDGTRKVSLIVNISADQPVKVKEIHLLGPTGHEMVIGGGRFMRNGYRYLSRTDGNQFLAGPYKVTITSEDLHGVKTTASGTTTLEALPGSLPQSDSSSGVTDAYDNHAP